MAAEIPHTTVILAERPPAAVAPGEKLSRWLVCSLILHAALIATLFIIPFLPARSAPKYPVYTVDLVGGEKIGGTRLGTELTAPPKQATKSAEEPQPRAVQPKAESKKEKIAKPVEKATPAPEKLALKEKPRSEKKEMAKEKAESGEDALERVRERLIQSAVDRVKNRAENTQPSSGANRSAKGEAISTGPGEGEGAAALGTGGRGGGVVKGIDFIIYQNKMRDMIKGNWAWVGQNSNLKVVVHFGIKENGDIVGLKIIQASGDPSYDESVLRALRKSSPLPAPPEQYRKEFSDVELTFRPKDLGA